MMTIGGTAHILMLVATIIIIGLLMFIVSKVNYKVQCIMIHSAVLICMVGILFLHLTRYGKTLDFKNFFEQMFQVCNFNFILLPLCLIRKNELGRQYLFYFSMFAAASTFVAYPSDVSHSMWYSVVTLNFWIDHMMVVAVTLMMVSAKWLKPKKEYIIKVLLCIVAYFFVAFIANLAFNGWKIDGPHNHSYTMNDGDIMALAPFYKLIPVPFVYLLPIMPILGGLFYLMSLCFTKYKVNDITKFQKNKTISENNKNEENICFI